jgi:putative transposase
MREDLSTRPVLDALEMAIANRRPGAGLIFHSDRGCRYTSYAFGRRCKEAGILPSMGSVGDALDNAVAESFFATLECELIGRSTFRNRRKARMAAFEYIEAFSNPRRRHSSIGMLSPAEFERRWAQDQTDVA